MLTKYKVLMRNIIFTKIWMHVMSLTKGSGGGGLTQKCRTCMGWGGGGVFGTQNTKVTCTLLYNKGGVSIFYPESQKYKWYFCTHIS